jgi:hypothetical protein
MLRNFSDLLAQANGDNGAGAIFVIGICVVICLFLNRKPPKKIETWAGQKTTEHV